MCCVSSSPGYFVPRDSFCCVGVVGVVVVILSESSEDTSSTDQLEKGRNLGIFISSTSSSSRPSPSSKLPQPKHRPPRWHKLRCQCRRSISRYRPCQIFESVLDAVFFECVGEVSFHSESLSREVRLLRALRVDEGAKMKMQVEGVPGKLEGTGERRGGERNERIYAIHCAAFLTTDDDLRLTSYGAVGSFSSSSETFASGIRMYDFNFQPCRRRRR
ncbi:hypothetical protein CPB83DRAFT_691040 [Crepidotus variabilis]|uniref:Uncharacterized protein n=1 Tax=Crepidotus variabilis TaxID=179855 RepID=A0A9P6JJM6_9AGAR|nr:hypothetical protein CPB83DRAFT_691040 [Crepidotus variabilis]